MSFGGSPSRQRRTPLPQGYDGRSAAKLCGGGCSQSLWRLGRLRLGLRLPPALGFFLLLLAAGLNAAPLVGAFFPAAAYRGGMAGNHPLRAAIPRTPSFHLAGHCPPA